MTRRKFAGRNGNGNGKRGPYRKRQFTDKQLLDVELLEKLGATNETLALFFGVNLSTIEYWTRNYPTFAQAKKRGGIVADMNVVQSLYKRAMGFEYEEKEFTNLRNKKTGRETGMQLVKTTKKYVVPSDKSISTWLRNRQRQFWSEAAYRVDQYIHGSVEHTYREVKDIPIEELSKEEQNALFIINRKQLKEGLNDN